MTPADESPAADEARAQRRYILMNLARIASFGGVIIGFAMARGHIAGPWALGAGLALIGTTAFFFGPPLLARRWTAQDQRRP